MPETELIFYGMQLRDNNIVLTCGNCLNEIVIPGDPTMDAVFAAKPDECTQCEKRIHPYLMMGEYQVEHHDDGNVEVHGGGLDDASA